MKLLRGLLPLAYPFVVFAGLRWLEPRWLALLLGGVLLLRAATRWRRPSGSELRGLLVPAGAVLLVVAPGFFWNDERYLLFVPGLVNVGLLVGFARSLWRGPPLVEVFARMQHPELSEAQVRHCRSVNVVWCAFFTANATVCFWLALAGDLWAWTLYTGLVAYLLMGLLFAIEFVVRSWRFRNYQGTLVEPLFRRLFPQGPAS